MSDNQNASSLGPGPGAYMLPTTIGFSNHDPSRFRSPQYTMRPRHQFTGKKVGPGPQYDVDKVTRNGKVTQPAYTIAPKLKGLVPFKTPGPGTYSPENAPRMKEPRPPMYSISARFPALKKYNTPGPNQYALPSTLGPRVPNKSAAACYSIAGKHDFKGKDRSPGPAKYGDTNVNLYKNKGPQYSMGRKCPPIKGSGGSPGPASYLPGMLGRTPGGVSFGTRHDQIPYITAEDHMPCIGDD